MKSLQRILSVFLLFCLAFSLIACGRQAETPAPSDPTVSSTPTTPSEPSAPTEPVGPPEPIEKVIVDTTGMTELQKAIVVTAESYYLRGKYAQYDQYSLTNMSSGNANRRFLGLMAPEDYTSQYYGYTDCSSFVYDVYKFALGMEISNPANTKTYCAGSIHTILAETPKSSNFAAMTTEELDAKEKEFRETLQPGDIIAYRAADGSSGHAMLYVGNNMMIHSSGSTYDYKTGTEKVEKNGTYSYDTIEILLNSTHRRYLFEKSIYVILRPLNKFEGEIPAHTQQRMDIMRGIAAEKLCSLTYGKTITPGDTLTYTIRVKNNTSRAVPLLITDTVPDGTTYVSGADTVAGQQLSWNVTVPKGSSVKVSYSVQVNTDTPTGTFIQSTGSVGGISVKCPAIKVARTLSEAEQQAIKAACTELAGGGLKEIALANAIYEKACGKAAFTAQNIDELWSGLVSSYNGSYFILDMEKPLVSMMAPRLYGGRSMATANDESANTSPRTRLVTKDILMIGDIVLADDTLYMFTGEGLYNLTLGATASGLYNHESLLRYQRFVVLRPSITF